MKNPQDSAKAFAGLMRKIGKSAKRQPAVADGDAVETLVKSFLMWDCTATKADTAYKKITDQIVDFNDLRVTMPHEIVEWIGPRYPNALERCQRLRAALRHTYKREHAVSLDRLRGMGRREIKRYLRTLDGIAPYVADRVTLLCFDAHCIPVDDRLRTSLIDAGVCDETVQVNELSSWLARQVKAAEAASTHAALQAWCDRRGTGSRRRKTTTRRKTTSRKRTAKSR